jgi:glycosyltransferase involved in cell wall biosynthesis
MKQKNKPEISVIMSTYKEPLNWITESIDSILNQTLGNFEFIIINDNPKRKDLGEFLNKYKEKDERIVLIKNPKNMGLTKSLNKGLKKATGKYIARMDADDISMLKRFKIQYHYLEKHRNIFLCSTCAINIDKSGRKINRHFIYPFPKIIAWRLKTKDCLYHPTIMFKNEGFLYNEKLKYAQDYGFYLNLIKRGKKLIGIPKFLLRYRRNNQSISGRSKREQMGFAKRAKEIYLDYS